MDHVSLSVPKPIVDRLPSDGDDAGQDMQQAVAGWQGRINAAIDDADDEGEIAAYLTDAIERMESRMQRYDDFVPELRAWGQSPIYAIAWRNLHADLIAQLYEHESVAELVDRERNYRLVDDGISLRDLKKD